jgi:hypothetical protein
MERPWTLFNYSSEKRFAVVTRVKVCKAKGHCQNTRVLAMWLRLYRFAIRLPTEISANLVASPVAGIEAFP